MKGWQVWDGELRPKEIMFFSADLVGSTSLKQEPMEVADGLVIPDRSRWFDRIQDFYLRSVAHFVGEWVSYRDKNQHEPYVATMMVPKVWKTIGDEVLFWAEIRDSRQVLAYLWCWIEAMRKLREHSESSLGPTAPSQPRRRRPAKESIDVKCCSWIAHFPWRNKVIFSSKSGRTGGEIDNIVDNNLQLLRNYFSREGVDKDLVPDFVGPGIDIGFRLAQQSTSRRFVISTDVAYMMSVVAEADEGDLPPVHFEGVHILKGVLGGLEYPMFWIDMSDKNDIDSYGSDLKKRESCAAHDIISFMGRFYNRRSNYMYPPFIVSETETLLTKEPSWYRATHEEMLTDAGFTPAG